MQHRTSVQYTRTPVEACCKQTFQNLPIGILGRINFPVEDLKQVSVDDNYLVTVTTALFR